MSLVHEQLYKDNKIELIDIQEYLRELCDSVIYSYHDKSKLSVTYNLQVEEQNLTMDLMIPIGLVFNELVTNSIKHAFDGIADPAILIRGRKDADQYIFEYRDNGVGFSGKTASKENNSLGMLIISTLMIQIEGDYKVDGSDGLRVSFSVPLPK